MSRRYSLHFRTISFRKTGAYVLGKTPLVLIVAKKLLFSLLLGGVVLGAPLFSHALTFEDFATASVGKNRVIKTIRPLNFATAKYITKINESSRRDPDFAGHYILTSWGCGTSCVMFATIDVKNGSASIFPFSVSDWPLDVLEPLEYHLNSRLLIVRGRLNEGERASYYFKFNKQKIVLIKKMVLD